MSSPTIARKTADSACLVLSIWAKDHNLKKEDALELLEELKAVEGNSAWYTTMCQLVDTYKNKF